MYSLPSVECCNQNFFEGVRTNFRDFSGESYGERHFETFGEKIIGKSSLHSVSISFGVQNFLIITESLRGSTASLIYGYTMPRHNTLSINIVYKYTYAKEHKNKS